MSTQPPLIPALLTLLLSATSLRAIADLEPFTQGTVTFSKNLSIGVEIADTEQQRQHGLMQRISLESGRGMLFVFDHAARQGVWMKDTLIALDVLFLSEQGQITEILKDLQPCPGDPCPIYVSKSAAKYMLELQAGFIDTHHVEPGQTLQLEYRHVTNSPALPTRPKPAR